MRKEALKYLRLNEHNGKISFQTDIDKKFAEFDLFFYVQVICKFLQISPEEDIMLKMISNGAKINYLSEYNENALFKV